MTDNKKSYTSVKVPKELASKIQNHPIYKHYGYRSVSEFILTTARQRIEVFDNAQ